MRQVLRPSMWLFLALALAGAFDAEPAGAWRREFRGTNTTFDAHASAVVLDGAGDVIATGQVRPRGDSGRRGVWLPRARRLSGSTERC